MNEKEKMEVAVIEKEQLNNAEINENTIKNLIYVVRGKQVMLDSDLAMLYQVETGNLNKAMKRNVNRFPKDFCFQLTKDEFDNLIFQNGISNEPEAVEGNYHMSTQNKEYLCFLRFCVVKLQ